MREQIDLTGPWRFRPDPFFEGEPLGYGGADLDLTRWRDAVVPSIFDKCGSGLGAYEGAAWYARTFDVPADWQGRYAVVRFEGVNYRAKVWLNGQLIGEHPDGFLRFDLPAGPLRCGGENLLAVRVDNTRRQGEVPGMQRGWRPFGGILREVALIGMDPLRVAGVRVTAEPTDGGGALALTIALANDRAKPVEAALSVEISDAEGNVCASLAGEPVRVAPAGEVEVALDAILAGARPWSPDDPRLYTAQLKLQLGGEVVDATEVRFGFRRIEARDAKLLLNGKPIILRGFNRHEDSPTADMCTDLATARRDLLDMKSMGCNFVRLCHYPHHPGELDLCDEIGLLAMDEIPLYWWDGLDEGEENCAKKLQAARRQVTGMIRRDINHPSLIFWSVSNETMEGKAEVVAGNEELIRLARELDPTRLAVHVSVFWWEHPHFDEDDVICVNAYPGWSSRRRGEAGDMSEAARFWTDEMAKLHQMHPDKPILVTEFGHPSMEGVFGTTIGEDAQAEGIAAEFAAMGEPYVCGTTIWCYADHPWPEGSSVRKATTSPYGVVTRERRRLAAYEVVKKLFTDG